MPGGKLKSSPGLSLLPFEDAHWSPTLPQWGSSTRLGCITSGEQQRTTFAVIFLNHLLSCAKHYKTTSSDKSAKYQGAPSLMGKLELFPGSKCAQCCKWADTTTPAHAPWIVIATMTLLYTSQRISGKYLSTKPANFSFKGHKVQEMLRKNYEDSKKTQRILYKYLTCFSQALPRCM